MCCTELEPLASGFYILSHYGTTMYGMGLCRNIHLCNKVRSLLGLCVEGKEPRLIYLIRYSKIFRN